MSAIFRTDAAQCPTATHVEGAMRHDRDAKRAQIDRRRYATASPHGIRRRFPTRAQVELAD
jgi:hypothetical protein